MKRVVVLAVVVVMLSVAVVPAMAQGGEEIDYLTEIPECTEEETEEIYEVVSELVPAYDAFIFHLFNDENNRLISDALDELRYRDETWNDLHNTLPRCTTSYHITMLADGLFESLHLTILYAALQDAANSQLYYPVYQAYETLLGEALVELQESVDVAE